MRHWLMLLFADRVNVVEGLFEDAMRKPVGPVMLGAGGLLIAALLLRKTRAAMS